MAIKDLVINDNGKQIHIWETDVEYVFHIFENGKKIEEIVIDKDKAYKYDKLLDYIRIYEDAQKIIPDEEKYF